MILFGIALSLSLTQPGPTTIDQTRIEAARANYGAIMQGRKDIHRLNPQELAEVLAIADALNTGRRLGTRSENCVAEEKRRVGRAPSALTLRAIDMKCREPGEKLK